MTKPIRVSEIFGPTVQGEGLLIGRPTVFVRTGGCDFRCAWCDTLYAVLPNYHDEWRPMTPEAMMIEVERRSGGKPVLVTLSGGNPALQPLAPLIALGHDKGYSFAMETQGSVAQPWLCDLDWLILSPKPPSSAMVMDWNLFDACLTAAKPNHRGAPRLVLKIVVFDEDDYAFARLTAARYPSFPFVSRSATTRPTSPIPPAAAVRIKPV